MRVQNSLSVLTKRALDATTGSYLSKDMDEVAYIASLKEKYGLERVYRFDVGKNTDGFSPKIAELLESAKLGEMAVENIIEYPDNHYRELRNKLAAMHNVQPDQFVFGAGLDSVIDQLCRSVFDAGDPFLLPVPNFDVFEEHSKKSGGEPIYVQLPQPDFLWSGRTVQEIKRLMHTHSPKVVWISNPVNPTGQDLPLEYIFSIVEEARHAGTIVAVDEAYGEYTDRKDQVVSASCLVPMFDNLVVLRTFSKMYALPSARVGYMISSSAELRAAVETYRPMFPFSWVSLYLVQQAVEDVEYVHSVRERLFQRRERLFAAVEVLEDFTFLPSESNTVMFRHNKISADVLNKALASKGLLTANLNTLAGVAGEEFLRLTVRTDADNDLLVQACIKVEQELKENMW